MEFIKKVHETLANMGKAPTDDRMTEEAIRESTRKTIELYEQIKEKQENK